MGTPTLARLGDPNLHFWLTRSVGRAMGLSLGQAVASGDLAQQAYCDMVTRCRRCMMVEGCKTWLGEQAASAEIAPDFCPNNTIYDSLKPGGSARKKDKTR